MRKFKFIVSSIAAVLVLSACSGAGKGSQPVEPSGSEVPPEPVLPVGELPEGGVALDLSSAAGKQTVYNEVMAFIDAYTAPETPFTGFGLKSQTQNVNADATLKIDEIDEETGKSVSYIDGEAHIENFGATIEAKIAGDDESWGAEASVDINGKIAAKANVLIDEEKNKRLKLDEQLAFDHVGAQAWLTGTNVYVDASGDGLRQLLEDAKPIVAKVLPYIADVPAGTTLDLNAIFDAMGGEDRHFYIPLDEDIEKVNPIALVNYLQLEEDDKPSKEEIEEVLEYLAQIPFLTVQTYEDGRFGIAVDVDMEQFIEFAETMDLDLDEDVFDMIPEAHLKVAIVIRPNGWLDSISIAAEATVDYVEEHKDERVELKGHAYLEEIITASYNDEVTVTIPSADELAEYQLFDPEVLGS